MENMNLSIGLQLLDGFTKPAQKILNASKSIDSTMLEGQKKLNEIGNDRRLIAKYQEYNTTLSRTAGKMSQAKLQAKQLGQEMRDVKAAQALKEFQQLNEGLSKTSIKMRDARAEARQLGQQIKAMEKDGQDVPAKLQRRYDAVTKSIGALSAKHTQQKASMAAAREEMKKHGVQITNLAEEEKRLADVGKKSFGTLKRQHDAAVKSIGRLNQQHDRQKSKLGEMRGQLRAAGYDTRTLADAQRRLGEQYAETGRRMKQMAMDRARAAEAQKQFDHTLQKAANMTFIAQGMRSMGQSAMNVISRPVDQMRSVERAKGDLQALGIEDTKSIINRGREMQKAWAYIDTASFTRAAYDIKSGISSLADIGVADVTEQAALTSKATKGDVAQMTSLFSTGYGIFKEAQFKADSDKDFASKFGAGLSASVQRFKTTGAGMQQAIESMGAGLTVSGVAMSEQFAALGMLQGSMSAGTAGTTLSALERSSARAQERFDKEGLDVEVLDANGNMKSLADLLQAMQDQFGKEFTTDTGFQIQEAFGSEEAVKFFKQLWGQQDQLRAHSRALGQATEAGAAYTRQVAAAVDRGNEDARLQKAQQRWALVQERFGVALIPFLDVALPLLEKFADWTSDIVQNGGGFSKFIVGSIGALALFGTAMAPVVTAFASLTVTAAWLRKSLQQLGVAANTRGGAGGDYGGGFGDGGGKRKRGGRMRRAGRGLGGLARRASGFLSGGAAAGGGRLLSRLGGAARSNALLGAGLGAITIGNTLMDDSMTAGQKAKAVTTDMGSIGGGLAGMTIGATLGSVVPVVGTAIGGILGGLVGSMGGEKLVGKMWDWFGGDDDKPGKRASEKSILTSDLGRNTRQVLTGATVAAGMATAASAQAPLTAPNAMQMTDQSQTHISVTVPVEPGMDAKQIAELTAQAVDRILKQKKREAEIEKGARLYDTTG